MDNPRPGSVRVNGGPWLPCRFTLDGTSRYVDWDVDADTGHDFRELGNATVEIAICPGVIVTGDAVISDVLVSAYGSSFTAVCAGPLRSAT